MLVPIIWLKQTVKQRYAASNLETTDVEIAMCLSSVATGNSGHHLCHPFWDQNNQKQVHFEERWFSELCKYWDRL